MSKKKISVIVPCFNEGETVSLFYDEISKIIKKMDYVDFELLFVNDGSKDETLNILKNLSKKDKIVKYISFSRNFGKEAAMYAGLEHSTGDYISFMDADLQDPPSLLIKMYDMLNNQDYDIVVARRVNRKGESRIISFCSELFYKMLNKISGTDVASGERDFRLFSKEIKDSILKFSEYNRYLKGLFCIVGYNKCYIEYDNINRVAGKTKFGFIKLCKYAIEGIVAQSTLPLSIASVLGVFVCLISFISILVIIIKTLLFGDPVGGWPSMVCILLFVSGIQLLCMGIIGKYLSKTYLETKKRPIYIIKEKN